MHTNLTKKNIFVPYDVINAHDIYSFVLFLVTFAGATMGTQEQPCYTLIQGPSDTEQPSEMQLRQDLGNYTFHM